MNRRPADRAVPALVVDDDDGVRALLVELLERDGFQVIDADSGERALALIDDFTPRLAVLEVQMPGRSGYDVCIELRRRFRDRIAIIFVSGSRTESFDRVAGLRLGADDYVTKPFDPEELLARVHALVRRTDARQPSKAAEHELTPREIEVLCMLGDGKKPAAIAVELHITPKTVAKHIERITKKLKVNSRSQAIAYAFREGLIG